MTKEGLTEEEIEELRVLKEWEVNRKKTLLKELRYLKKHGTLTEEEQILLEELEEWEWNEYLSKELEELRRKLEKGTITDEERRRL